MRATEYTAKLNDDRIPYLEKVRSQNFPAIESLDNMYSIAELINKMYDARHLPDEHLWIIGVDNKRHARGIFELNIGTSNASVVNQRGMFTRLLLTDATSFSVVHNHPSLCSHPSDDDIHTARKMKSGADILELVMDDFIIIGDDVWSARQHDIL